MKSACGETPAAAPMPARTGGVGTSAAGPKGFPPLLTRAEEEAGGGAAGGAAVGPKGLLLLAAAATAAVGAGPKGFDAEAAGACCC